MDSRFCFASEACIARTFGPQSFGPSAVSLGELGRLKKLASVASLFAVVVELVIVDKAVRRRVPVSVFAVVV